MRREKWGRESVKVGVGPDRRRARLDREMKWTGDVGSCHQSLFPPRCLCLHENLVACLPHVPEECK